jgi:hypothetical protein
MKAPTHEALKVEVSLDPAQMPEALRGDLPARAQLARQTPSQLLAQLIAKAIGANTEGSPLTVKPA